MCAICTEEFRGRRMTDNSGGLKSTDYSLRKYELFNKRVTSDLSTHECTLGLDLLM